MTRSSAPSPCLIHLAFACILIAAKLEEPIQPSFKRMTSLALKEWEFKTTVESLVEFEQQILFVLDWNLVVAGPIFFLERF